MISNQTKLPHNLQNLKKINKKFTGFEAKCFCHESDHLDGILYSDKATKMFNLNIASVLDLCTEPSVKIELEKLAESFRFSDPVSSDATEDIESTIMEKLENLKISISSSDSDENIAKITELKNLLAERNRICKVSK